MKILSVSDLQRTTDAVREQQLNQTCFGNCLAQERSRRAGVGLIVSAQHHPCPLGERLLGLQSWARTELGRIMEGKDVCDRALRF